MLAFLSSPVPVWVLLACLVIVIFAVGMRFSAMQGEIDRAWRAFSRDDGTYLYHEVVCLHERIDAIEARRLKNRLIRWLKGLK